MKELELDCFNQDLQGSTKCNSQRSQQGRMFSCRVISECSVWGQMSGIQCLWLPSQKTGGAKQHGKSALASHTEYSLEYFEDRGAGSVAAVGHVDLSPGAAILVHV